MKQRESLVRQQVLIKQELDGLMSVAAKGYASMNRVRQLQRAEADLEGQEAAMTAEYARAGEGIGETRMQSLSVTRTRLEAIEGDLKETQSKLSETLPKLVATRQQLEQSQVRSPVTGQVVGLTVFTIGGVVRAGETLMEVVPDGRELVIRVSLNPGDADDVFVGQPAQVRFASVHDRSLPLFTGQVRTMSADSFTDEKTGRSYFQRGDRGARKRAQQGPFGPRQRRASARASGRGGVDRAQAHRAAIYARAADWRAVALRARRLTAFFRKWLPGPDSNRRPFD